MLTTSKRRLEVLRQVAARVVPGGRRDLYQFAMFDVLSAATFATATRCDLDGKTYAGVLYGE